MASAFARCLSVSRNIRSSSLAAHRVPTQCFSTSPTILARHQKRQGAEPRARRTNSVIEDDLEEIWEHFEDSAEEMDSPTAGHLILQNQRQMLHYMRLIEHEMPKLVGES